MHLKSTVPLTPRQVAAMIGKTPATVRSWCRNKNGEQAMTVQAQVGEVNQKHASATVLVNGVREYFVFVGREYVTIATGNAIKLRSPGKTFHNHDEVATHYKRDGVVLRSVVAELNQMRGDCR